MLCIKYLSQLYIVLSSTGNGQASTITKNIIHYSKRYWASSESVSSTIYTTPMPGKGKRKHTTNDEEVSVFNIIKIEKSFNELAKASTIFVMNSSKFAINDLLKTYLDLYKQYTNEAPGPHKDFLLRMVKEVNEAYEAAKIDAAIANEAAKNNDYN
jgi:hypothetical protein